MNIIKNIIQIIVEEARMPSPRMRLYILGGICTIGLGICGYFVYLSSAQFSRDYEVYAFLAKTQQNKAYIPGASDNPVRQNLNQVLSEVLTNQMTASERLALVTKGLSLVQESDNQINDITVSTDAADAAIAKMQVDTLGAFSISQRARELIALAKKRSSMISDIRAYSYRADFDVKQIFEHIIADRGKLSDAYVIELNAAVPAMEDQFNKRTNLYTDLLTLEEEIDKKAAGL